APTDEDRAAKEYAYEPNFARWVDILGAVEVVRGNVRDFPEPERAVLSDIERIVSIAVVPIFVDETWWGFLGFDDCISERDWSSGELDALRAAAAVLGAAIGRHESGRARDEMEARYRTVVEQIPAVTYIDAFDPDDRDSSIALFISPQVVE